MVNKIRELLKKNKNCHFKDQDPIIIESIVEGGLTELTLTLTKPVKGIKSTNCKSMHDASWFCFCFQLTREQNPKVFKSIYITKSSKKERNPEKKKKNKNKNRKSAAKSASQLQYIGY